MAVTLFLVQNGVLPARPCVQAEAVAAGARAGVEVFEDDFALRERRHATVRLAAGVKPASLEVVVYRLAAGDKDLWH